MLALYGDPLVVPFEGYRAYANTVSFLYKAYFIGTFRSTVLFSAHVTDSETCTSVRWASQQ